MSTGNIFPQVEEKITPNIGKKLPTNNTNLKHYQGNNNKEGEDAVVAVDFKKIREKGKEKMQAIREQLRDLDFEGKFIEQLLKDYPLRKIEKKLDLLMERRNIQSPAGWLMAAIKNNYQDVEQEGYCEESAGKDSQQLRIDSRFRGNDIKGRGNDINTPEQVSREKALKAIKLIQDNLSACISPLPSEKSTVVRENLGVR